MGFLLLLLLLFSGFVYDSASWINVGQDGRFTDGVTVCILRAAAVNCSENTHDDEDDDIFFQVVLSVFLVLSWQK